MKIPINTFHFKSQFNHKLYKLNDVHTLQNMSVVAQFGGFVC